MVSFFFHADLTIRITSKFWDEMEESMNALSTEVKPCRFSAGNKDSRIPARTLPKVYILQLHQQVCIWILSFCQFTGDFDDFQDSRNPETWKLLNTYW